MNLIQELEKILNGMIEKLQSDPQYSRLIKGELSQEEYLHFLIQTYHYVINTPKTLLTVAKNLEEHPNPEYQVFRQRFLEHAKEEMGHENWVLKDIRALGYDREIINLIVPSPAIHAYNAYSNFVASSQNPIGIFGQSYILEGLSEKIGPHIMKNISKNNRISNIKHAMLFISSHAEADIEHMKCLIEELQSINDENDKNAIRLCADIVAQQYSHLLHYTLEK